MSDLDDMALLNSFAAQAMQALLPETNQGYRDLSFEAYKLGLQMFKRNEEIKAQFACQESKKLADVDLYIAFGLRE